MIYYNARYYVPGIGRFASADTIVPDPHSPQAFNRYSYTMGNPIAYTDPTGHFRADDNNPELRDPIDYGYLRARQVAIEYLLKEFSDPFQDDAPVNRGFSSDHDGIDFGGNITVRAPANGIIRKAQLDQPAGMWRLGRVELDEEGNWIFDSNGNPKIVEHREWSVFDTTTENPLQESDRINGLLVPEQLLASGEWIDLNPGWSHTRGTVIVAEHEHGLETVYYHTIYSVQVDMNVSQGDVLGQTTNNGWSSGIHLHYSIRFTYDSKPEYLDLTVLGLE